MNVVKLNTISFNTSQLNVACNLPLQKNKDKPLSKKNEIKIYFDFEGYNNIRFEDLYDIVYGTKVVYVNGEECKRGEPYVFSSGGKYEVILTFGDKGYRANFSENFSGKGYLTRIDFREFLNFSESGIDISKLFYNCKKLKDVWFPERLIFIKRIQQAFYGCELIESLDLSMFDLSIYATSSLGTNSVFYGMESLTNFSAFKNWKRYTVSFGNSPLLTPLSVHEVISNAMNLDDGATSRKLTLHATAKENWEASEYYEQDLTVLTDKGITIA